MSGQDGNTNKIEPMPCLCDLKPEVPYVFSLGTGKDYKGVTDSNTVDFDLEVFTNDSTV